MEPLQPGFACGFDFFDRSGNPVPDGSNAVITHRGDLRSAPRNVLTRDPAHANLVNFPS